jgi:hypothetical protein
LAVLAWSKCRQVIRTRLDEEATRQAQNARQALLRPYYESFEVQEKNQRDVFPHFVVFLKFKSILPLWESEDATIDDEIWQEVQRNVSKDLDKWEEGYRVETIRLILAANQGLDSTSSLSNDPADYPESTYDNAFFSRMTSLFCTRGWSRAHGRGLRVESYPSVAQGNPSWGSHQLQSRITPRHIMIIRSLLEAAGLDPEISTYDDLEELEPSFVWVNDPRPTYRRRRFHRYWLHLVRFHSLLPLHARLPTDSPVRLTLSFPMLFAKDLPNRKSRKENVSSSSTARKMKTKGKTRKV